MSVHPFVERLAGGRTLRLGFYGTSLTAEGAWVPQLTDALRTRFPGLVTTVNGAESGMHSRWGVENLDTRILAHAPDAVFIEFSVNDACARFGITVAEARANLETMIDRIQAANPACDVILQVMNPVLDRPAGHDGHRPELAAYQDNYRRVGTARGLLVIDHMPAWTALLGRDEAAFRAWVPDGLHPQAEGYARLVTPEILERLGVRTALREKLGIKLSAG